MRDRRDDLPLLIEAFLGEMRAATGKGLTGFTPDATMRLTAYDWPGNVREPRSGNAKHQPSYTLPTS